MTVRAKRLRLADLSIDGEDWCRPTGHVVATVQGLDALGQLWVLVDGRLILARPVEGVIDPVRDASSIAGRQALVVFIEDHIHPVVTALLARDLVARAPAATSIGAPLADLEIDGRKITLEAGCKVTLRCGEASLTMTADGRIVMKGVEIVSRALRNHKIKGGAVNIN
jgi:hypothetical protein